tara:strand:- start:51 stop:188 length:138 start_codon:yes stop_codon:yes gene_type:complete
MDPQISIQTDASFPKKLIVSRVNDSPPELKDLPKDAGRSGETFKD